MLSDGSLLLFRTCLSLLALSAGSESFLVDAQGTNAQALAGIGSTIQQLTLGATVLSQELFCENTDPDAIFYLPDGTAVRDGDPKLGAFLFSFKFAPGADVNGLFAVSSVSEVLSLSSILCRGLVRCGLVLKCGKKPQVSLYPEPEICFKVQYQSIREMFLRFLANSAK
jgi:hypothetical protein